MHGRRHHASQPTLCKAQYIGKMSACIVQFRSKKMLLPISSDSVHELEVGWLEMVRPHDRQME